MTVELEASAAELRRKVRAARRAFAHSADSQFVKAMKGAMREYERMRAEGVSRDDAINGIEAELREAWPHKPSKFEPACLTCDDTGWRELFCDERMRCGRERCAKRPEIQHAYVEACSCPAGDKHRARVRTDTDALAAIGKTRKKRGSWSRLGV